MSTRNRKPDPHPFAYPGLDRVFHERARLSILNALVSHPRGLPFSTLRELCDLTDGNLNRHLLVLNEAGLLRVSRGIEGNRPQTRCYVTARGRRRYLEYLTVLEQVVHDAAAAISRSVDDDGRAVADS